MNLRHVMFISTLTFACIISAQNQAPEPKVHTISQFRLPDMDENGRVRGEIFGDTARVPEQGLIDITNMRLFTYDADESVQIRISAPNCIYDRKRSIAGSHGSVLIENRDFILCGEGYRCYLQRRRLEINNKARLVLRSIRGAHQGEPPL